MENKPPIYNKEGKVVDPEVARQGAQIEDKYRKKLFGLFKHSKEHIERGEREAETVMEQTVNIETENLPPVVTEEFNKYAKAYEGGEIDDLEGELKIENATVGDLGGGSMRYRLHCELDEGIGIVGFASKSFVSDYEYLVIIIDVKNNSVTNSKVIFG